MNIFSVVNTKQLKSNVFLSGSMRQLLLLMNNLQLLNKIEFNTLSMAGSTYQQQTWSKVK